MNFRTVGNDGPFPMFTLVRQVGLGIRSLSSWIRFPNPSVCKSPQNVWRIIEDLVYAEKEGIDPYFCCRNHAVAMAKKFEVTQDHAADILTVMWRWRPWDQLRWLIKPGFVLWNCRRITDDPFGEATGAGYIFGATGAGYGGKGMNSCWNFHIGHSPGTSGVHRSSRDERNQRSNRRNERSNDQRGGRFLHQST